MLTYRQERLCVSCGAPYEVPATAKEYDHWVFCGECDPRHGLWAQAQARLNIEQHTLTEYREKRPPFWRRRFR